MHYLDQYFRIYLLVMDLSNELDQIEPFKHSRHRTQHDVALVTLVIMNTIAQNSLVEFEQVKCFISSILSISICSMDFRTKLAQIEPFENSGHRK